MDSSDAVWYLTDENNQPIGPFTAEVIREWCIGGRVHGGSQCWREDQVEWRPMSDMEQFRDVLPIQDVPAAGIDDIGKAFGKLFHATKRKARATSLNMTVHKHEKRRRELLAELGRRFYESGMNTLAEAPYAELVLLMQMEDRAIAELRAQIEALDEPVQPGPAQEAS